VRRHLLSALILPFNGSITIPGLLLYLFGGIDWAFGVRGSLLWIVLAGAGLLLVVGLTLFTSTVRLFARVGRGTLAPWDATRHLVVVGPYAHVRNPMISAVLFVLVAESIVFGSLALLAWFALFTLGNVVYMPLSEEKGLVKRFGEEYLEYKKHVRAWIPRLTPWRAPQRDATS